MKKRIITYLLMGIISVMSIMPAFAQDQEVDTDATVDVSITKSATYSVKLPLSVTLSQKTTNETDSITCYTSTGSQTQVNVRDSLTKLNDGENYYAATIPVDAKGVIAANKKITVTPDNTLTLNATSGDTVDANIVVNIADKTKTKLEFAGSSNTSALTGGAYLLGADYSTTKEPTTYIYVKDSDIDAAEVYTGSMNFTISYS